MEATSACVAGDVVHVVSACIVCRMPSGTYAEGVASEMTPSQIDFLQKQMHVQSASPPRNAAAWEVAIREAGAKRARPN
jgi:hypothetical protein